MEGQFKVFAHLQGPNVHWHLPNISSGYKLAYMVISRAIWKGRESHNSLGLELQFRDHLLATKV